MQIIRRRGPRPLPDLQEPKTQVGERDPLKSYFSTSIYPGEKLHIPSECTMEFRGTEGNKSSFLFIIDKGQKITKT